MNHKPTKETRAEMIRYFEYVMERIDCYFKWKDTDKNKLKAIKEDVDRYKVLFRQRYGWDLK